MNTRYALSIALLGFAGSAFAQQHTLPTAPPFATPERALYGPKDGGKGSAGAAKSGGDVVWYEDFANGLAGNTAAGAWSTALANGNIWKWSLTGPVGAYSDPTAEVITSTSASNGFMAFWSDSVNSSFATDPPEPLPVFTPYDGALVSPVLDLSATPNLVLVFEHRMRFCCADNPYFVEISTDGGSTWPTRLAATTAGGNDDPGTVTASFNISAAIAADLTNVRIRFFNDGNGSGTSHYFWQVDDVQLVEAYDFDLQMTAAADNAFDTDLSFSYDSLEYSIYPFNQLRALPLNMTVLNNGAVDQTNATANFTVDRAGTTVLDQDQTVANIPAGVTSRIFVNPDFVPPTVAGTYDCSYTITSSVGDATTTDNAGTSSFKVDEFIYARDGGTASSYEDGDGAGGPYFLCNGFHIAQEAELYSVDVALRSGGSPSPIGNTIIGTLQGADLETTLAETLEHEIVATDLNGSGGSHFVSLIFDEPQLVEAGGDYFVCIQTYGGNVRTGINGSSPDQTSFIFYNGSAGETWYYTNSTPMVRMNFDPTIGIEENDYQNGVGLGQCFPNPANETAVVPFDLATGSVVGFQVHDVSGKLMLTSTVGTFAAGAHRFTIDTSVLPEGVYLYTLSANGTQITKRMTVIH